ncbi:MAG: BrnT family toxin [Methylococcaceae bacterium]
MISYDDNKRQINLKKHGIDLAECVSIFDHLMITKEDARENYGEQRLQSLGLLNSVVVFMVWIDKVEHPHLISVREATNYEQKYYYANIGY